ncbi:Rrf2 family transcriptional regulator [Kriegella sp. EG-1]|nr:Rrf2 family transcriptional regulator [Flavobacteriaceae bacterium EG-1]
MISNSSKYALNGVLYLAANSSKKQKILAKELSENTGIPKAYLSKLMQELARQNLISSVRGPNGGFYLTNENLKTHLIDIIHVIDGHSRINSCMLGLHECNANHPCPLHNLMSEAQSELYKKLEQTKIQDLVSDIQDGKSFLSI